jgi:hypothetical protein
MAFTRKNVAAAVAGTLSLAMLTGCPAQAPTGTSPSAPASAAPSAPTSAAPTTATSAAPASQAPATGTIAPSAAPSVAVSAPPASGKTVIVSGTIYNEKGATVDGATVTVKSLDASVPYTATVQATAGSYVVNNVPEGANVEVVVTKDGWTSRRRVQSFQQAATGQRNVMNFGGSVVTGADNSGVAYFISDYPEIASTTPEHDQKDVDGTKLNFKVVLSEALDADSRKQFERSFYILPANSYAVRKDDGTNEIEATANNSATWYDLEAEENDKNGLGATAALGAFKYNLAYDSSFRASSSNKMKASWNTAGTELTLSIDAPLQTDDTEAAKFQAAMFANSKDDKIKDAKGNQLGTSDEEGKSFTWATANGNILFNVFRDPDLAFSSTADGTAWAQTHKTAVSFEVKPDNVAPKVTGLGVTKVEDDLRIELTFSEPMAAYRGTGKTDVFADPELYQLDNYRFLLGRNNDLNSEEIEAGAPEAVLDADSVTNTTELTVTDFDRKEFRIQIGTLTGVAASDIGAGKTKPGSTPATDKIIVGELADSAKIGIEVDPEAPAVLNIWIKDGKALFNKFDQLKARVEDVKDPAGKNITPTEADKNLVTADL